MLSPYMDISLLYTASKRGIYIIPLILDVLEEMFGRKQPSKQKISVEIEFSLQNHISIVPVPRMAIRSSTVVPFSPLPRFTFVSDGRACRRRKKRR